MDLDIPAYQGVGWRPRFLTSREEADVGGIWSEFGLQDQYSPLRSAAICLPHPRWPSPSDWISVQYLRRVDFQELRDELLRYVEKLIGLGVQVEIVDLPLTLGDGRVPFNAVFARDMLSVTPEGAICGRMASTVRAGEEVVAQRLLARARVPVCFSTNGRALFEGADLVWLNGANALLGVGERTNSAGAAQICTVLAMQGVSLRTVPLPRGVQHLLGILQIVSHDLALVRCARAPESLLECLSDFGYRVVAVPETQEVLERQALNFTVVQPNAILMHSGSPGTRLQFEKSGINVISEITAPNLVSAGGGIACATAVLGRDTAAWIHRS